MDGQELLALLRGIEGCTLIRSIWQENGAAVHIEGFSWGKPAFIRGERGNVLDIEVRQLPAWSGLADDGYCAECACYGHKSEDHNAPVPYSMNDVGFTVATVEELREAQELIASAYDGILECDAPDDIDCLCGMPHRKDTRVNDCDD